ncbi:hypothetical protein EV175_007225, partial [Coemansia sp. RSA 1933]
RLFRELCEIDVPDVNMKIYANLRRVDPSIALLAPSSALAMSLLEDIRASVSLSVEQQDSASGAAQRKSKGGDGDTRRVSATLAGDTHASPQTEKASEAEMAVAANETQGLAPLSEINAEAETLSTTLHGPTRSSDMARSQQQQRQRQRVRSASAAHLVPAEPRVIRQSVDDYFSQPQRAQEHRHSFHSLLGHSRRATLPTTVAVSGAK